MNKYLMIAAACLTLGLAPFTPEPHIFGKIRWILGGAEGMSLLDWWDTIMHGAPWAVLIVVAVGDLFAKIKKAG